MRCLAPLGFAAAFVLAGCDDGVFGPWGNDSIEEFIAAQDLPDVREIETVLSVEPYDIQLFRVSYGEPQDCPSGCFYSTGYGLRYRDGIGWIRVNHYDHSQSLDTDRLTLYDVTGDEKHLFTREFDERVADADSWLHRYAFHEMLARDSDTPRSVLLRLARGMQEYIHPHLGWVLLDNPHVVGDQEILETITSLPDFEAYQGLRARAQELLDT